MQCTCGQHIQSSFSFCPKCGTKVTEPLSPVGTWHVKTDSGDQTKDLGFHTGHIVDIARDLGSAQSGALKFEPVMISATVAPYQVKGVVVQLDFGSYMGMTNEDRVRLVQHFLNGAPAKSAFKVDNGTYYGSVALKF